MNRRVKFVCLLILAGCFGLQPNADAQKKSTAAPAKKPAGKIDDAALKQADAKPGEWITHGRDYAETRFSPLKQINDSNVKDLGLAWSFDTQTDRGLEATPIIVDGVMYTTGSWSIVYALDARTGKQLWKWDPKVPHSYGPKACCDVVNRGVAVYKGRVYVGTLDGRLAALDAATGAPVAVASAGSASPVAPSVLPVGPEAAVFAAFTQPVAGEQLSSVHTLSSSHEIVAPGAHPPHSVLSRRAHQPWHSPHQWHSPAMALALLTAIALLTLLTRTPALALLRAIALLALLTAIALLTHCPHTPPLLTASWRLRRRPSRRARRR